jgi:hypothetical protein
VQNEFCGTKLKEFSMAKSKRSTTRRTAAPSQAAVEFNPDYTDVKRDLKRIGILAGSFITLLVVLSFFLR